MKDRFPNPGCQAVQAKDPWKMWNKWGEVYNGSILQPWKSFWATTGRSSGGGTRLRNGAESRENKAVRTCKVLGRVLARKGLSRGRVLMIDWGAPWVFSRVKNYLRLRKAFPKWLEGTVPEPPTGPRQCSFLPARLENPSFLGKSCLICGE